MLHSTLVSFTPHSTGCLNSWHSTPSQFSTPDPSLDESFQTMSIRVVHGDGKCGYHSFCSDIWNRQWLRLGMMFFSSSFFWLVSSPIQGALIGVKGSFWPLCVFSGSTVILGVGFMSISRILVQRETRSWKV
ncbi:hypothetical protein GYMLUDRAFT_400592 [Collybiopsis luxurians FD-317 M1]|nr:hypothetical protein GYMLUDRAFT_400592 [Collybiopsis luxurians FD-317 M1]